MEKTKRDAIIRKIYDAHKEYHIYPDVYTDFDGETICVEINWGDWKHEHGASHIIMSELGAFRIDEEVTEEDGSDCYSAICRYAFIN